MPDYWKEPWITASTEALRLLSLSVIELKDLPERFAFELPQNMSGFSGEVDHGVMLNGDHAISVIISSEQITEGKVSIRASFEVSYQGEILVQPRPMWSGPNTESLNSWVYGYEPQ